jgi:hypothetical protein
VERCYLRVIFFLNVGETANLVPVVERRWTFKSEGVHVMLSVFYDISTVLVTDSVGACNL